MHPKNGLWVSLTIPKFQASAPKIMVNKQVPSSEPQVNLTPENDSSQNRTGGNTVPIPPLKVSSLPSASTQIISLQPDIASSGASEIQANASQALIPYGVTDLVAGEGQVAAPKPPEKVYDPVVVQQANRQWRWAMVLLTTFGIFGGIATSAFLWLTSLPPLPNCKFINGDSPNSQQFFCAQEKAKSGSVEDLTTAIALVKDWKSDTPYYQESRKAIDEWSARVFAIAQRKFDQGDVTGALNTAKHIPTFSKVYGDSQKVIQTWQGEWKEGKEAYDKALAAINAKKWKEASQQILVFSEMKQVSWAIDKADELRQKLTAEFDGNKLLDQAKAAANSGSPEKLAEAVTMAKKIADGTNVRKESEKLQTAWIESIVSISQQRWDQGEITAAFAAAKYIPLDMELPGSGADLVRMSYAYELADKANSNFEPDVSQIFYLNEAIAVIEPIQPGSPFFTQAYESRQSWKAQVQDLIQLEYAVLTGELQFAPALDWAIAQAKEVKANRPRRLQAQTLAAHWTYEKERMGDRAYLAMAEALAEKGGIGDLKTAIAQANVIPKDRPIWREAKDWIGRWQQQIQTLEDKPLLKQAEQLAKQKKWDEAIKLASKVTMGRALHPQAKAAIANWQAQINRIQTAEDRPTLNEAYALAKQGRLSSAMDVAAKIKSGRALYGEAQSAIAEWDSILNPPAPIAETPIEPYDDVNGDVNDDLNEPVDIAADEVTATTEETEPSEPVAETNAPAENVEPVVEPAPAPEVIEPVAEPVAEPAVEVAPVEVESEAIAPQE